MKKAVLRIVWLLCLFLPSLLQAAVVTRVDPPEGSPGDLITIRGSGFESPLEVRVGGVAASISTSSSNAVTFNIPVAGKSGSLVLRSGLDYVTNRVAFIVTRSIPGRLEMPASVSSAGYNLVVRGEQPVLTANQFTAKVAVDGVTRVWAFRMRNEPAFLAVVTPTNTEAIVSAVSTAEALVLMLPIFASDDPAIVERWRRALVARPELPLLTAAISTASGAGRDYLDDPRVRTAWGNAASALAGASIEQRRRLRKANHDPTTHPTDVFQKYLNPLVGGSPPDIRRLNVDLKELDAKNPTQYRLSLEAGDTFPIIKNPLDWFVQLYELEPRQFANGFESVNLLNEQSKPTKLRAAPDQTAVISASLASKYIDLLDVAAGLVTDWFFKGAIDDTLNRIAANELPLPARTPGAYMVEAYSGNLWYGTEVFGSVPNQSALIRDIGGNSAWGAALAANIVIAAIDGVPPLADLADVLKKRRAGISDDEEEEEDLVQEIIWGVSQDVAKALAIHGKDLFSRGTFYDFLKNTVSSLAKNLTAAALDKGPTALEIDEYGVKIGKTIGKVFDVLGDISSVLQALERATGLIDDTILGVERTVVVVGDPFKPELHSFFPQVGRGGEVLTIVGHNLPAVSSNVIVSFCQFGSTADPNQVTAKTNLTILRMTTNGVVVRVPTNVADIFPNRRAYICVEIPSRGFTSTTLPLDPPYREFRFLGPPELTAISPNPTRPGGGVQISGRFFEPNAVNMVMLDGQNFTAAAVTSPEQMLVYLPLNVSTGFHTLRIKVGESLSNPLDFEVRPHAYSTAGRRGQGLEITVSRPDFTDLADDRISLGEAFRIANGTLGRNVTRHLPCESLPPDNPSHCPPQRREEDDIRNLDDGPAGGPASRDIVRLSSSITNGTVIAGAIPPFTSGDYFNLPVVIDGAGAGSADGLTFDGVNETSVSGLVLRNFSGHGVVVKGGSSFNELNGVQVINCGGTGLLLEGSARNNSASGLIVSNATLHGLHLTGADVKYNSIRAQGGNVPIFGGGLRPYTFYAHCGGNGIRIDGGASFNDIFPGTVRENAQAGIVVAGAGTTHNLVGRLSNEAMRDLDVVKNGGPGVHLDNVQNNLIRYLNVVGNQGDGILLEGSNCASNQIDRTIAGPNLYEGGTSSTLPNEGSGIHLRSGAHHNLIGSLVASFGYTGSISGNRDDGVLIEGEATAYNVVNAQNIGLLSVNYNPLIARFAPNGKAGLRLRDGAHHNTIGEPDWNFANTFFAAQEAAIVIEGPGTRNNLVFGNQIGSYFSEFDPGITGVNRVGIWIRDSANANTIGWPGGTIIIPYSQQFPNGGLYIFGNTINRCSDAGIVLENAGGHVGTDGQLRNANVIQGNRIGEEDSGNIAPNTTGLRIDQGAFANVIGGPLAMFGNRIQANRRAGIHILSNSPPSASLRNRLENNFIAQSGITGPLRYSDLHLNTPAGGVGLLLQASSGHVLGESHQTENKLYVNRIAIYLADSSSNSIFGMLITNSFNAGIVVRGGSGNRIGSGDAARANRIHGFGINEPGQAGVILAHTTGNVVSGNSIGFLAPGRGGVGMLITNASLNLIGGSTRFAGNVIVSNRTNGMVIAGPLSTGNRLHNNFIGVDRDGVPLANQGDGIRLESGASGNFIGGRNVAVPGRPVPLPSGNHIAFNRDAGVRVDGAATLGNSILYNSISTNDGKGIAHTSGGNELIPPPVFGSYDGSKVTGTVDLSRIPAGSTVQIFVDPDAVQPEGDAYLGRGTVRSNGTWSVMLAGGRIHQTFSMTATHAESGSTSEFGTGGSAPIGFQLFRTDAQTSSSASPGALQLPVFKLSARAINADVRVRSIAFDATGSLPDPAAVTSASLYRDTDEDGVVGPADYALAAPVQFLADNGRITFATSNIIVEANSTQRWVVAFNLAPGTVQGNTFQLSVTNTEAVLAEFTQPLALEAVPLGDFAINSALFTVGAGPSQQTFAAWQQNVFTAQQLGNVAISGPGADPDSDGLLNLLEYAFNLNPLAADRDLSGLQDRGIPQASRLFVLNPATSNNEEFLAVTFVRRKPPVDLIYRIDISDDLQTWIDTGAVAGHLTTVSEQDVGDGTTLQRMVVRPVRPSQGQNALPRRYLRVRVEHAP